jgi:hypothetical protein
VLDHIDEWFGLESATYQFIDRNTYDFYIIDKGVWKKRGWGDTIKKVLKKAKIF